MAKKKAAEAETAPAPSADGQSWYEQVRDYLQAHPDQSTKDITDYFVAKGASGSTVPQYLSKARKELGISKRKGKRARKPRAASEPKAVKAPVANLDSRINGLAALTEAIRLLGPDSVKQIVETL